MQPADGTFNVFTIAAKKETKSDNDMIHSARVLFLACAIIQAGKLKLTVAELKQLSQAIVYHDIGRNNDAEDDGHSLTSRQIYGDSRHDAVTAFLIEFHVGKMKIHTAICRSAVSKQSSASGSFIRC